MANAANRNSGQRQGRPQFQGLVPERSEEVPPDGSESSVSSASSTDGPLLNLQAIHTQHMADADDIDWQAHPRLERRMRKLYTAIAQTTMQLEDMKARVVNDTSTGDLHILQEQLYASQMEHLSATRRRLLQETAAIMTLIDPDVTGTVMDRVKSANTREAENDFNIVWKDYQRMQKASWTKYGWTLMSGTFAYAIPFGIGTMISRYFGLPWLVMPIAGTLHTLCEPFWTSIRSVTWTNPNIDATLLRQRVRGRAAGDVLRQCASLEPKQKFIIPDPDGGAPELVSAEEFLRRGNDWDEWADRTGHARELDRCGLLNWIDKVGWLQWADKVFTDDVPFFVFTLLYSAKNSVVEYAGMDLYRQQDPTLQLHNDTQHSVWVTVFHPNYSGKVTSADLGLQFLAGMLSGACTMLISQALRRHLAHRTNGREVVTKSLHVWKLEARFLRSYIQDIDKQLNRNKTATPRSKYAHDDHFLLEQKKKELETQLATAEAKSGILRGFWYDMRMMWQGKRRAVATGPDISGKRLDTICSILGRCTSLAPGVAISYLASPYQHLASTNIDPVSRALRHIAQPIALVAWPGFNSRLEWQGAYRIAFGALKGMYSACVACCTSEDDEDEDEDGESGYADDEGQAQDHVTQVTSTTARRNLFPDPYDDEQTSTISADTNAPGPIGKAGAQVGNGTRPPMGPANLLDADDSVSDDSD